MKSWTLILRLAWLLAIPAIAAPSNSSFSLTILHDNDFHGQLLPFAYTETALSSNELPSVGGIARRATLIRSLRASLTNESLLLHGGDVFTRGPLTTTWLGEPDIEAMNALGYQAASLGNNEFKAMDGVDATNASGAQAALLSLVKRSRFPWVCANAVDSTGAFLQGVKPFVVLHVGGVHVGILGLTTQRSAYYPQTRGWTVGDPVAVAKQWIPKAREACDVLLLLSHLGVSLDKSLAASTRGIDAIIGGDSHTFLYRGIEITNEAGIGVPIVQAGEYGVRLGRFDLRFEKSGESPWRVASWRSELLLVDDRLAEAADLNALLAPYLAPFRKILGRLDSVEATPAGRARQTQQFMMDGLRRSLGATFALAPDGGGLFDSFRSATITRYDVYAAMPFHNNGVTISMTAAEFEALLAKVPKRVLSGDTNRIPRDRAFPVALVDYTAKSALRLPADRLVDSGKDVRELVIGGFGKD
ncbi:MAG: bifunctional metallophosphatase/5'-nucleotidase [Spirochaetes bacterium]|nr:bifunctional metallophosphatase/5'-nucleotidase [Spirochaetota bacterium]